MKRIKYGSKAYQKALLETDFYEYVGSNGIAKMVSYNGKYCTYPIALYGDSYFGVWPLES